MWKTFSQFEKLMLCRYSIKIIVICHIYLTYIRFNSIIFSWIWIKPLIIFVLLQKWYFIRKFIQFRLYLYFSTPTSPIFTQPTVHFPPVVISGRVILGCFPHTVSHLDVQLIPNHLKHTPVHFIQQVIISAPHFWLVQLERLHYRTSIGNMLFKLLHHLAT